MKDPLLALVSLKPLEEIIAAAKETIHRHRRRFLQHNLRPCPANCFAYETPVLIRDRGFVPIGANVGKAILLGSNGSWISGEIQNFGKQYLMGVELMYGRGHTKVNFNATPDHRWKLTDGSERTTLELQQGDTVPFIRYQRKEVYDSVDYLLGVRHGLIYGDGTATWVPGRRSRGAIHACKRIEGYCIRLCRDAEELLPYFDGYSVAYPASFGGDPVVRLYDSFAATHELKRLPSTNETEDYLVGFFRGWIAADGTASHANRAAPSICCGSEEETWLRQIMPNFGYYFMVSSPLPERTNFGKRNKDSRNLPLFRPSLTERDFLIKRKRRGFMGSSFEIKLQVYSIVETNRLEETFCAVVPSTEDFVIDKGVLTGNCQKADMVGHKVVGCSGCGSPNSDKCLKESKFEPILTKDELARQFADQLRNPEVLLREYRDIIVFLWVLGAFDKQKRTVDEHIVSKVEQREDKARKMAVGRAGGGDNPDSALDVREPQSGSNDPATGSGTSSPASDDDKRPAADNVVPRRVASQSAPGTR